MNELPAQARRLAFPHHRSTILMILLVLLTMSSLGLGLIFIKMPQDVRSKATNNGPVLTINPSTKSLGIGQTTTLGITINTKDDTVSAAELHLTYDKTAIQVTGFTAGTIFPVILKPAVLENGFIDVAMGVQPATPFKGVGTLGTITIRALSATASPVQFSLTTQVTAIGKTTNVLASKTGSTITGVSGEIPTPTTTRIPGSKNTPTPTRIPGTTGIPVPSRSNVSPVFLTNTPLPVNTRPQITTIPDTNSVEPVAEDYSPFPKNTQGESNGVWLAITHIVRSISGFFQNIFK